MCENGRIIFKEKHSHLLPINVQLPLCSTTKIVGKRKTIRLRYGELNSGPNIVYRPGCENVALDALSRVCASRALMSIEEIHNNLDILE